MFEHLVLTSVESRVTSETQKDSGIISLSTNLKEGVTMC